MNILFITANRLGDAVLSSGLLAHLIASYPQARVTVACGPVAAPLFAATPNLRQIKPLVKKPWAAHWLGLWRASALTKWDIVIDLRASALAWLVPARRRIILRKDDGPIHRAEMYSRALGLSEVAPPTLHLSEADRQRAESLIPNSGSVLAIGPTANWGGKQWPTKAFCTLVERLTAPGASLAGSSVAVLGGAGERHDAEQVLISVPEPRRIDLIGTEGLLTLAACLERSALYVGNDSGLMHLAAASGVPTLGLFGPSREVHYAPWGEKAAFVRTPQSYDDLVGAPGYDYRSHDSLMTSLTTETVEAAVIKLLESTRETLD